MIKETATPVKETGDVSIDTENIFPIIKKFLYSDHEIFLRELVSNAVDATQKLKKLVAMGEFKEEMGDVRIHVAFDKKKKTITVTDRGIGMTAEEIKKYINQIAFSGAAEFVEKFKDKQDTKDIIGKFGLGFYSSFMVADKVELTSRSYAEKPEKSSRWICDGSTQFTIEPTVKKERGTTVVLHLNKDSEEFLDEFRLKGILDKYCKFLPVEIQFGKQTKSVPDGEDKDGKPKYKSVEEDRIINHTKPLWTRSPKDIKEEEYLSFYKELYPFSEDPLFWIHLNVDYPFTLTGILYFPKVKNDFELQKNKIQLYSRQVFITDEVKDVVPDFLMLLHGVLDSPDIPLNVSRSYLQSDSNVKKISQHITKKVADRLLDMYKKERKKFEERWDDISLFVKYGMVSDDKFYDRAKDFVLLKNIDNKYFSLNEYAEKVKTTQTDKDKQQVYLYATDAGKQDVYIQAAKKKAYDVLLMDGALDSHFIGALERKLEKVQLKQVDSDTIDNLIVQDKKIESVLSEKEQEEVKKLFDEVIQNKQMTTKVESMAPDDMPVLVTMDEWSRRMKDMARTGGGMPFMMGNAPDRYNVLINGNHNLIQKTLKAKTKKEKETCAKQLYDLALLSQNMLTGNDLTRFIKRSLEWVS